MGFLVDIINTNVFVAVVLSVITVVGLVCCFYAGIRFVKAENTEEEEKERIRFRVTVIIFVSVLVVVSVIILLAKQIAAGGGTGSEMQMNQMRPVSFIR